MAPRHSIAPDNYKRSLLAGEAMRFLHKMILNGASHSGAWTNTVFIALHVLGLIELGDETLERWMEDPKKSLSLLRETQHEATSEQIALRHAYNAALRVLHDDVKSVRKPLNGISAINAGHLEMLARAVAWGFVSRSTLARYRDNSETGFIDRQGLLDRMAMPDGVHLIDITRSSHSG
jgi:hypothetical protein